MSPRVLLPILLLPVLGGCRSKAVESFLSATTPHDRKDVTWKGDPYASGGYGDQTGGLDTRTTYGAGSDPTSKSKIDPLYDAPGKGTGLHPGDPTVENRAGFGKTNAPALQPDPAETSNTTVRSAR